VAQHIAHHLAPAGGVAGVVVANGSMSSQQSGEGAIRRAMVEADLVDCTVALPGQLLYATQIPVYPDAEKVKQLVSLLPWGHVIRLPAFGANGVASMKGFAIALAVSDSFIYAVGKDDPVSPQKARLARFWN
jgi:hypothetical protein